MMLSDSPLLISLHNRVRETKNLFFPLDQGTQSPAAAQLLRPLRPFLIGLDFLPSRWHKMPEGFHLERPLFAGALTSTFPQRFQEVFVDPSRDESLIFEILELKEEVGDDGSASWFLQDLASEQESEGCVAISKGRQGREAQNVVRVYVANVRLKEVNTDILISAYEPIHINPLSESATAVGAGAATPAELSGCTPMVEVFKLAVSTFKVNNWGLFGSV
ncbi:hypothetical protein F8388_021723 [Cannabis sativa]|uniref:Ran guanine nucleotide release factor n=1 Tax=Cannabis sativa TaxID=3483 RepID=A0A7J6E7B4_CANSA|nr:hypothetical protein F8388_021723 [Cannabis sativa]